MFSPIKASHEIDRDFLQQVSIIFEDNCTSRNGIMVYDITGDPPKCNTKEIFIIYFSHVLWRECLGYALAAKEYREKNTQCTFVTENTRQIIVLKKLKYVFEKYNVDMDFIIIRGNPGFELRKEHKEEEIDI